MSGPEDMETRPLPAAPAETPEVRPQGELEDDGTELEGNPFAGLLAEAQKPGAEVGEAVIESQPPRPARSVQRAIPTQVIRNRGEAINE